MKNLIKSITDVITNSSTEVYVYYPDDAADRLADLIDGLLEMAGCDKDAKDFFEIQMKPSAYYYDYYVKCWDNEELDHEVWPENPTDDVVRKFILQENPNLTNYDLEYPKWDGVEVISKDPKYSRLAEMAMEIFEMCDYEGYYS